MERALDLVIVTDSPICGHLIQLALVDGHRPCRPRIVSTAAIREAREAFEAEVALIAIYNWHQFPGLLPYLRRHLTWVPWLLLAERRLAGMFLNALRDHPCALVSPAATSEELWEQLQALVDRRCCLLDAELIAFFARGVRGGAGGPGRRLSSLPELQCACGVSLGLTNREIAAALRLQESSVKTYLYRLMRKLGVHDRRELAALVSEAMADAPGFPADRAAG